MLFSTFSVALASPDSSPFAAFASARDQREHTQRTIHQVAVSQVSDAPSVVAIDITGDGFLHNMVRIMIGTLVDVARGHLEPGAISRAVASRDRRDLGVTAPPDGLYLDNHGRPCYLLGCQEVVTARAVVKGLGDEAQALMEKFGDGDLVLERLGRAF